MTKNYNAVFALISLNLCIFVFDQWLRIGFFQSFYLHLGSPRWYQFITSLFCHISWSHLSGNLFFLYVFGRIIEEEKGAVELVFTYLICGMGANIMSYLLLNPQSVSLGASGSVFGLFTVGMLIKLKWQWRKILEVIILGQFVLLQIWHETRYLGQNDGINRVAHLSGALAGVATVYLMSKAAYLKRNKNIR